MAKRSRIDSISAQVEVMQKAAGALLPPDHVKFSEKDAPFWESIVAERAKSEWSSHDLEIAAMLARSIRCLEAEELLLETEGTVLAGANNPIQNPRVRVVADLHARVIKYRQTLGIHSRGKNGEQRDVEKRRSMAKDIERNNPLDDDLLARPSIQ